MKRILSFVLAAVLLLSCFPVTASAATSGKCGDNATWTFSASTGTLTIQGTGAMYDYIIEYPGWTDIDDSITSIVINNGITYIGENSFALCSNISSITIPSSVTRIGSAAFTYCSKLANIYITDLEAWLALDIADDKADPMGAHPQLKYLYLNNRLITDLVIPEGSTHIRDYAFYRCVGLESVSIPDGVVEIGKFAFERCENVTEISLPDTLTGIGESSFTSCKKLTSIKIPDGITVIADNTFGYCENLVTVTTGPSITSIGGSAFYECGKLADFMIPDTVTTIGKHAFHGCKKLTSVVIPDGVTEIAQSVFHSCTGLSDITIPSNVTSIGSYAFYRCSNLKSITLPRTLSEVGKYAFYYCDKLSNVSYYGTEAQRELISIGENNYRLTAAEWYFIPCEHIFGDWAYSIVPTCKEGGEESRTCSLCGEVETRDAEPTDHTYDNWTVIAAATCTENGIEVGTCIHCGTTRSRRTNPVGHSCDQWTMTTYPTCTEDGEQTGLCSVCQSETTRSVPSLGHEYTASVTPPTCTENGYTTHTCYCGDSYTTDEVTAAGHSWSDWSVTLEPTVTANGEETRTCGTCGETETKVVILKKPAAPDVKVSNKASSGKPKVSWEKVSGAAEYKIYRATSKKGSYELIKTTSSTSCTDSSAKTGKTYYYKVKAANAAGTSSYSNIVNTVCDLAQPEVTVKNTASSGKSKLSWDKISGVEKYNIYRASSESGSYSKIGSTTSTSYTDSDAKTGKKYYYKVKAIHENSSAHSAYSEIVSSTRDLKRPDVSVKLSSNKPKLNWEKVSGAEKYYIYRATSEKGEYEKIKSTTKTSYTDKSAKKGKTYYYKVKAVHENTSANSAYSSVDKIKSK